MTAKEAFDSLVRHAEHYGTDEVYETARDNYGFAAIHLGQLAMQLRRISRERTEKPRWELDTYNRVCLMERLFAAEVSVARIADMVGVTLQTVRNHKQLREAALQSQENREILATQGRSTPGQAGA